MKENKMKKISLKALSMLLAAVMLLTVFAACSDNDEKTENKDPAEETQQSEQTAENYDGKLVFDHSMELTYAKCFSVDYYKGGYKLIKLVDDSAILVVPEGMSVPAEKPNIFTVNTSPVIGLFISSFNVITQYLSKL